MSTTLRDVATYTGAQTDAVVRAVAAGMGLRVSLVEITVNKACTVNVDANLEFDEGTDVLVQKFNGIPPGGGIATWVHAVGADGDDLLFTCTVPTGGDITVKVSSHQYPTA